jgi:hypothetical protein
MKNPQRRKVDGAWSSMEDQYMGLMILILHELKPKAKDIQQAEPIRRVEAAAAALDECYRAMEKAFKAIDEAVDEVERHQHAVQ